MAKVHVIFDNPTYNEYFIRNVRLFRQTRMLLSLSDIKDGKVKVGNGEARSIALSSCNFGYPDAAGQCPKIICLN